MRVVIHVSTFAGKSVFTQNSCISDETMKYLWSVYETNCIIVFCNIYDKMAKITDLIMIIVLLSVGVYIVMTATVGACWYDNCNNN